MAVLCVFAFQCAALFRATVLAPLLGHPLRGLALRARGILRERPRVAQLATRHAAPLPFVSALQVEIVVSTVILPLLPLQRLSQGQYQHTSDRYDPQLCQTQEFHS